MNPILYSFRRCPYAIRARLAIRESGVHVFLREIVLRDKPTEMLAISPKGTVPVLRLTNGDVCDESLDIMFWALNIQDQAGWMDFDTTVMMALIDKNDTEFKKALDRYKYSDRYPEYEQEHYRRRGEKYLLELEGLLSNSSFLMGERISFADIAIFPFIRQFAFVDIEWFNNSSYQNVKLWLEQLLTGSLFVSVMQKYPVWKAGDNDTVF